MFSNLISLKKTTYTKSKIIISFLILSQIISMYINVIGFIIVKNKILSYIVMLNV